MKTQQKNVNKFKPIKKYGIPISNYMYSKLTCQTNYLF